MNSIQRKIADFLASKIFAGAWGPGELIPGERELAEEFHTNIMNAKNAVGFLVKRGFVHRKRHAGTFVCRLPDPELAERIFFAGEKVFVLLHSENGTGIHWDEESIEAFSRTVRKKGAASLVFPLLPEKKKLESFLTALAAYHPEGVAILDDNFDHRLLLEIRHVFELFSCPAVILNRMGRAAPLHIPHVSTLDIDHFHNGYLAGKLALSFPDLQVVTVNNVARTEDDRDSLHCKNKQDGILTALQEAGKPLPTDLMWDPGSLGKLAEWIRQGKEKYVIIALNQEIGAKVCNFMAGFHLTPPLHYRMITIEDQKQYEKYAFTTIAIPKEKTGCVLGELLVSPELKRSPADGISFHLQGEVHFRSTF